MSDEMQILQNYLRVIAINTSREPDTSYQFPTPDSSSFELAASGTYEHEIRPQQKLVRLAISLPSGVVAKIYKNGAIWRRYSGIQKYDDGVNGEFFDRFKIIVTNTTANSVLWDVVATFVP